ncbi:MAG: PA0069 family radical SAM protein [Candidatus Omnitrophota bacterium]
MSDQHYWKGRGALTNPANRFETIHIEADPESDPADRLKPKTVYLHDTTKSLITYNDSPDVGFKAGINPYRGCEHGCIYCFARPSHEYLGFSSGLDFETRILVKLEAAEILRKELMSPRYQPQVIAFSGNTDVYQPVERKLKITRQCLEVMAEFRNPVAMITKNRLIERDIDLLKILSLYRAVQVFVSVTTLDSKLSSKMEPRASHPCDRLKAIQALNRAGVPVGVLIGPVIPGLTDEELPAILREAAEAGAASSHFVMLRLPYSVKVLFEEWLGNHFPEKKEKVLNRIRSVRSGKLNDPDFHTRMSGTGIYAEQVHSIFKLYSRRYKLDRHSAGLSSGSFRRPNKQLMLFDE